MASAIARKLKQYATYWPPASQADDFGKPVYEDAIEIKCRWEDGQEQYTDLKGQIRVSTAIVYVDRDLLIGGVLALGKKKAMTSLVDPFAMAGAREIQTWNKVPNRTATDFLRFVHL